MLTETISYVDELATSRKKGKFGHLRRQLTCCFNRMTKRIRQNTSILLVISSTYCLWDDMEKHKLTTFPPMERKSHILQNEKSQTQQWYVKCWKIFGSVVGKVSSDHDLKVNQTWVKCWHCGIFGTFLMLQYHSSPFCWKAVHTQTFLQGP